MAVHPTERLYRKIVKPSLGILNVDNHTSRHRIQLHSSYQPRMQGQLYTLRNRPRTEPTGSLVQTFPRITDALVGSPEFSSNFVYSYNSQVQDDFSNVQRSTTPQSFNSTSKIKQVPLPSVSPASKAISLRSGSPSRGIKSVSICSDRYIQSQSKHSGWTHRSAHSGRCLSEQQRRFSTEEKTKVKSKALKRASEIIPHRVDRMYYMSGATVPIKNKYHVDNEELERLKDLARSSNTTGRGVRARNQTRKGDEYIADRRVQGLEPRQLAITNTDALDGDDTLSGGHSTGGVLGKDNSEKRPATGSSWSSDTSAVGTGNRVRFKAAGPSSAKASIPGNITGDEQDTNNKDVVNKGDESNCQTAEDNRDGYDSGVEPEGESKEHHDKDTTQGNATNSEAAEKKDDAFMTECREDDKETTKQVETTDDCNNETTER
ncbi:uncharacterized protein LOC100371803 [Saccoglossus kowalevskii]|uniref:Uncharacterized protein LOC100371803 n=1 Tax=Saccoglossus kowalevskii TaxID=10224 RepID=A0ABM0MYU1_SACKO|nr:PREDICTED: uncharacterized protein LOC100371803 [Saccoglossus kowalevskii]